MNKVYVSHCLRDKVVATELMALAEAHGVRTVLLQDHPANPGPHQANFERDVHTALTACSAVVVLCSQASMASRWVAAEIAYARAAGKALFPVQLDDCELDPVLGDRDVIDLRRDRRNGWQQLWMALRFSGLGPASQFDWEPGRPPWPGREGYKEDDAAVFCGRDVEVSAALDSLYQMQRITPARLLMIVGPDGCGKASLLRAGLMPRLLRDSFRWIVLEPLDPDSEPYDGLAHCIAQVFARYGEPLDEPSLANGLRTAANEPDAREAAAKVWRLAGQLGDKLRRVAGRMDATPLLMCAGLERIAKRTDRPSRRFLALLRTLLEAPERPLAAVVTVESNALSQVLAHQALVGLPSRLFALQHMNEAQLRQAIVQPAEIASVVLETELITALLASAARVRDPKMRQAVVAVGLRRLWDAHGTAGYLAHDHIQPLLPLFERAARPPAPRPAAATAPTPAASPRSAAPASTPLRDSSPVTTRVVSAPSASAVVVGAGVAAGEANVRPELPPSGAEDDAAVDTEEAGFDQAPERTLPSVAPIAPIAPTPPTPALSRPPSDPAVVPSPPAFAPATPPSAPVAPPVDSAVPPQDSPPPPTDSPPAPAQPPETPRQPRENPMDPGLQRAVASHALVPPRTGSRGRAIGVALALIGAIVGAIWYVGHHAHHGIKNAHKAVTHSHDDIVPADTRHAARKSATKAAALAAVSGRPSQDVPVQANTATPTDLQADTDTQSAPPSGVATPVVDSGQAAPPADTPQPTAVAAKEDVDEPAGATPGQQDAAGAVVAKVLKHDAALTGLLALTTLSPEHHPENGLRAALQVDSGQLPRVELHVADGPVAFVHFNRSGSHFVAGTAGVVTVASTTSGAVVGRWRGVGFVDARVTPDGKGVVTLHDDGKARVRFVGGDAPVVLGAVRPPQPGRGWSHVVFDDADRSVLVVARDSLARLKLDGSGMSEELVDAGKIRDLRNTPAGIRVLTTRNNILQYHRWVGGKFVGRFIDRIQFSQKARQFVAARMSGNGKLLATADVAASAQSARTKVGITVWHRKSNGYWWNVRAKFLRFGGTPAVRANVGIGAEGTIAIADVILAPSNTGEHARHTLWFYSAQDWRRTRLADHRVDLSRGGGALLHRAIDEQARLISFHGKDRYLGGAAVSALAFRDNDDRLVTGHADGHVRVWGLAKPTTTRLGWQPLTAVTADPDGMQQATVSSGPGALKRLADGALAGTILPHAPADLASALTHLASKVVVAKRKKRVFVWRTAKDKYPMVAPLPLCDGEIELGITPDGRHLIASCSGKKRALLVDWAAVLKALRSKTKACMPADQRVRWLAEPRAVADQRASSCKKPQ